MQIWPSPPPSPASARIAQVTGSRGRGAKGRKIALDAPVATMNQKTVAPTVSVRPICRTVTDTAPAKVAPSSATSSPTCEMLPSEKGRAITNTPVIPSASASQRRGPTGSPSTIADSKVANTGAVKLIAVACAIGSSISESARKVIPPVPSVERMICAIGRLVLIVDRPGPSASHATTTGIDSADREKISIGSATPRAAPSLSASAMMPKHSTAPQR